MAFAGVIFLRTCSVFVRVVRYGRCPWRGEWTSYGNQERAHLSRQICDRFQNVRLVETESWRKDAERQLSELGRPRKRPAPSGCKLFFMREETKNLKNVRLVEPESWRKDAECQLSELGRPRKRPARSGFKLFFREELCKLSGSLPDRTTQLTSRWSQMSEKCREEYRQRNKQLLEAYRRELEAFAERVKGEPYLLRMWAALATGYEQRFVMSLQEETKNRAQQSSRRGPITTVNQYFLSEQMAKITRERPDVHYLARLKLAQERYSMLTDSERECVRQRWLNHLSTFSEEEIKAAKMRKKPTPEKLLQPFGRPPIQRKPSAWTLFLQDKVASLEKGTKLSVVVGEMGQMWKNISSAERNKYEQKAKRAKDDYRQALLGFAEKIADRPDLVQTWLSCSTGMEKKIAVAWEAEQRRKAKQQYWKSVTAEQEQLRANRRACLAKERKKKELRALIERRKKDAARAARKKRRQQTEQIKEIAAARRARILKARAEERAKERAKLEREKQRRKRAVIKELQEKRKQLVKRCAKIRALKRREQSCAQRDKLAEMSIAQVKKKLSVKNEAISDLDKKLNRLGKILE